MSTEDKNEEIMESDIKTVETSENSDAGDVEAAQNATGEDGVVEAETTDAASPPSENGASVTEGVAEDALEEDGAGDVDEAEETEPDPAAVIAALEQKLADAEAKSEEYFDRLQRTAAEFQNSKRRQEKQLSQQIERANARLIERLLPVLDDFDLAFRNIPEEFAEDDNAWVAGFQQIQKKLLRVLEDEQVAPMPVDGEFDPNRHEAVSSEPNDEVESGHIIETLRTGYEYKGQVLRPALVRVAL